MDPDANMKEQEALLASREGRGPRLRELRAALWTWLGRRGFEPAWHKYPRARRHFREYGGSNHFERCPKTEATRTGGRVAERRCTKGEGHTSSHAYGTWVLKDEGRPE